MGDYGQYIVPTAEEMVNFKVGQPAESMLPLDKLRECANHKFSEKDPMFLQYGHIYGYPKFRQSLAKFLTKGYEAPVDPERLFVTNGVTGGLSLVMSLFCSSGDLVFLEEPSYFLALSIMKDFKMNVRQIPMEQDGISITALEETLQRGIIPKMLYCIPTCHNPTGRTMSVAKRQRLVELSIQYGFTIIADEVYQLLSFPHVQPPPPMFTFDTAGTVLALGSFSKILAPSLRLGWIQAHPRLMSTIVNSGQLDSSGGVNPVISGIVHSAIELGHQQQHLDWTKATLWNRAETLMNALKKYLPGGITFEVPDGGYFILVRLADNMIASDLLKIASQKHKVQFLPGSSFGEKMKNYLRLSFSWYDMEDLALGAQRLADAIRDYASTLGSFKATDKETTAPAKLNVALHGATGRLGQLIVQELTTATGSKYAGAVQRNDSVIPNEAQVVVDVTLPQGTRKLLQLLEKNPRPLVVGTTGSDLPMAELRQYATKAPVVIKSNFSVGVPLVADLIKRAATCLPDGWNCELMESHHTKKLDAPSGTGKTLVAAIQSTGAKVTENGVNCKSLRLGDEIGQHTVYFAGPGERIEIKHQATRREVFAIGAIRTAEWIINQPNGLYLD